MQCRGGSEPGRYRNMDSPIEKYEKYSLISCYHCLLCSSLFSNVDWMPLGISVLASYFIIKHFIIELLDGEMGGI